MAEKTADEKLDSISAHIDSLHKRFDAMEGERKADKARMDAMDEWRNKCDAAEKERTDKARADAEAKEKDEKEKADKARMDAEAKEKDEKEKADKARADAAAAVASAASSSSQTDIARMIADIQARLPADLSVEDSDKYAKVQMRFDAAYQALALGQAPGPLNGESLRNYRLRLAAKIQPHSKTYKDSNLSTIGDENALAIIEEVMVKDSITASTTTIVPGAPLRMQTKVNPDTQHRVTTFHGDPAVCWGEFAGGRVAIGKIVRPPQQVTH